MQTFPATCTIEVYMLMLPGCAPPIAADTLGSEHAPLEGVGPVCRDAASRGIHYGHMSILHHGSIDP
jgi:hypothetical protein